MFARLLKRLSATAICSLICWPKHIYRAKMRTWDDCTRDRIDMHHIWSCGSKPLHSFTIPYHDYDCIMDQFKLSDTWTNMYCEAPPPKWFIVFMHPKNWFQTQTPPSRLYNSSTCVDYYDCIRPDISYDWMFTFCFDGFRMRKLPFIPLQTLLHNHESLPDEFGHLRYIFPDSVRLKNDK